LIFLSTEKQYEALNFHTFKKKYLSTGFASSGWQTGRQTG